MRTRTDIVDKNLFNKFGYNYFNIVHYFYINNIIWSVNISISYQL